MFFCFFFQAEDGIRDFHVTGVQTCALPIFGNAIVDVLTQCDDDFLDWMGIEKGIMQLVDRERGETLYAAMKERTQARSEERRVGRGGGGRGRPHEGGSEGQVEGEQRRKNTR